MVICTWAADSRAGGRVEDSMVEVGSMVGVDNKVGVGTVAGSTGVEGTAACTALASDSTASALDKALVDSMALVLGKAEGTCLHQGSSCQWTLPACFAQTVLRMLQPSWTSSRPLLSR